MAKDPQKPPRKENDKDVQRKHIDPRAHRRLLRFINAAQKPEDLMVAPHDRKLVDEEEAHTDHIEHHQEEKQLMDREQAKEILEMRDQTSPLRGFARLTDILTSTLDSQSSSIGSCQFSVQPITADGICYIR